VHDNDDIIKQSYKNIRHEGGRKGKFWTSRRRIMGTKQQAGKQPERKEEERRGGGTHTL
jgi:hypothetical protein